MVAKAVTGGGRLAVARWLVDPWRRAEAVGWSEQSPYNGVPMPGGLHGTGEVILGPEGVTRTQQRPARPQAALLLCLMLAEC